MQVKLWGYWKGNMVDFMESALGQGVSDGCWFL